MSSWISKPPSRGDHIRVRSKRIVYHHHGVFISNDEVIHFTTDENAGILEWSKAHVVKTNLEKFLDGGTVEVKVYDSVERTKLYPVEEIVEYARDCVDDSGYNPFFENCEHFANECTIGEHRSKQVETLGEGLKFVGNLVGTIGGKTMGFFGTAFSVAANFLGGLFSGSSSSGRRPSKTEKVKLAEIERDRQIKLAEIEKTHQLKLAEIEGDTKLKIADKENARAKIERDKQIKLAELETERIQAERAAQIEILQEQSRARMQEQAQQAKFAEMEHEFRLRLIDKDEERIGLMRNAQLDIIQAQTMSQIAIDRARFEGMAALAEKLIAFQEKIVDLSNKRLLIISTGNMTLVREVESTYKEIGDAIEARRDEYNRKKLPELLNLLAQYEKGSPAYEIYFQQINTDRELEREFLRMQMAALLERQQTVVNNLGMSAQKIIEQTGEIAKLLSAGYMESQAKVALPSEKKSETKQLKGVAETKKLSGISPEIKRLPAPSAK